MKPKIFIGSSTEALDVANAIQSNLEHDAETTVWNQGVFELSSTALMDLENSLSNFDAGIFVFHPDDIIKMRSEEYDAVRDNVIFEMGLFIGRLGREFVYYVIPQNSKDLHLPTDLIGITPGFYNDKRSDKNLKAALGPFCNQIRKQLPKSPYESLIRRKLIEDPFDVTLKLVKEYAEEDPESLKIAIDKPDLWEFKLIISLIKTNRKKINKKFDDINRNILFKRTIEYDDETFIKWIRHSLSDFVNLMEIVTQLVNVDLKIALREPGIEGDAIEIKKVIDSLMETENEFLNWELELRSISPSAELEKTKNIMLGWTKNLLDTINKFADDMEDSINIGTGHHVITITLPEPTNLQLVNEELRTYYRKRGFSMG